MHQISEFFTGFFDTSAWPARWYCGYWSDFHGWLYIVSDWLIWFAYFLIPVIILNYAARKKAALKFQTAYVYFAAFILLCGLTHLLDSVMFWHPMYRLNAMLRFITALVSLATVYYLIKILPEAFRQKTNVELEKEIARRIEAEQRLEDANRNLASFASIASHDLKEPLRKISVFQSRLNEENEGLYSEKSKDYANRISDAITRMQRLITDVLHLSSLPDKIKFEDVPLNQVFSRVLQDFELLIKETKAEITIENLPVIRGNAGYLEQLFGNLISNALKYNRRTPIVKISSIQKNNELIISISDNGIGIPEERHAEIFQPFHRLHNRSEFAGTGIGLTICKQITELHKGALDLTSSIDHGSIFLVRLPATSVSSAQS